MLSTAVGEKEPPRQRGRVFSHTTQILEKNSGAAAPPREFSRLNAYISNHTSQTKLQKKTLKNNASDLDRTDDLPIIKHPLQTVATY